VHRTPIVELLQNPPGIKDFVQQYFFTIKRFHPKFLYGYVSALYTITQLFDENGLNPSELKLHGICTTAEVLYEYQRKFIESVFNCPVMNEYGSSETGIISYQCPEGSMHLTNENLIVEFICNGRSALPTQLGNIIITDLNNYVMPLIRYKIDDVGSIREKPCCCGRGLTPMNITIGRECDMVVLKNGKLVLPLIFNFMGDDTIEEYNGKIKQFKVIQKAEDRFLMQIIVEPGFESMVMDYFTRSFRKKLGDYGKLDFEFVDEIPKDSSGKVHYFASDIRRDMRKNTEELNL